MKWILVCTALIVASMGTGFSAAGEKGPRQLQFNVRICEGDPLGSQQAGTLKVLADTRITTLENRPMKVVAGGEVPVLHDSGFVKYLETGRHMECVPGTVQGGGVQLDMTFSESTVATQTRDQTEINTMSKRRITSVKLGEVVKVRWPGGTAEKQAWIEMSVVDLADGATSSAPPIAK
jgi:hypothetical protein